MIKVGFMVNPVAGCGIDLGLKGSDHLSYADCIHSTSLGIAQGFLEKLQTLDIEFLTAGGRMGELAFVSAGYWKYEVIYKPKASTDAEDTRKYIEALKHHRPAVLVFFGGDGTARSVVDGSPDFPVIGVPAGTKMYSSVFAVNVQAAMETLSDILQGRTTEFHKAEVIDMDEDAYAAGKIETRIYGELMIPVSNRIVSESKAEYTDDYVEDAAEYIVDHMGSEDYLIGPGTTCKRIIKILGEEGSLLGFDLVRGRRVVSRDMKEGEIFEVIGPDTRIVISPIGGQGFLLGRGNRQLSIRSLKKINPQNIIVIASASKLDHIRVLYIDTGPEKIAFPPYLKVIYGYGKFKMVKVQY